MRNKPIRDLWLILTTQEVVSKQIKHDLPQTSHILMHLTRPSFSHKALQQLVHWWLFHRPACHKVKQAALRLQRQCDSLNKMRIYIWLSLKSKKHCDQSRMKKRKALPDIKTDQFTFDTFTRFKCPIKIYTNSSSKALKIHKRVRFFSLQKSRNVKHVWLGK